ncbi:hypothetical protein [Gemmobacter nectariphilus]|uniref:hypothetical protein n=1 Tax=Gemmobacter nectariphilus TaxID=220343 RepID=UPI0012B56018|nr:hypothetical protein [Gemmobacter nectariphilus]
MLATLFALILFMGLVLGLQSRSFNTQRVLGRLALDARLSFERDAVHERLRGIVADAMTADHPAVDRPSMDGTPFLIAQGDRVWSVRLQDVEALPDLYHSPVEVLRVALSDAEGIARRRQALLARFPSGTRYPRIEMMAAQLGLDNDALPLLTQSGTSGRLRGENAPKEIVAAVGRLPPHLRLSGETGRLRVTLELCDQTQCRP